MARNLSLDSQDRAALRKLDDDFVFSADGEHAVISGEMEITVERLNEGNQLLLTITFPSGEQLDVRIRRTQLLEQLDIEADEG